MHLAAFLWKKTHKTPFSYIFMQYSPAFQTEKGHLSVAPYLPFSFL